MDLFVWWALSISWSILFLIVVSIYLYTSSRANRREDTQEEKTKRKMNDEHSFRAHKTQLKATARRVAKDFTFVWFLLGLLVFYIFSVQLGTGTLSEVVFAVGNIVVEVLLVLYLFRNRE